MDIWQKEKESLAAYIHRFKAKTRRCNFTNDTANIRILVKGLRNAHSLATYIYKKGPETLTDAISKTEKLNATQQLMASIIPLYLMWCWMTNIPVSSVKNQGISHDITLTLGALSAMNMVTLSWTAHIEYLLQELQQHITNHTRVTTPDQIQSTTMSIETDEANPDHSPILEDIASWVIRIHTEATPDHRTGIDAATIGAVHDDLIQPREDTTTGLTITLHTHHIADHPDIKVLQVINAKITVGHIHDHLIDLQDMNPANQIHITSGQEVGPIPRGPWRWR